MTRLYFSNTANQTALSSGVVASDVALPFSVALTGWPVSTPYKAVIEPDTTAAEIVLVTGAGPSSFTVVRGQDGTTAQNHSAGSIIEHRWSAAEADEANLHANSTSGVHGLLGNVVGTTDPQILTNKTLTSPLIDTPTVRASSTSPALTVKAAATGTADLQEWQDNAGVALSKVGVHGELIVDPDSASVIPLLVRGATGQSVSMLELRDSGDGKLWIANAGGRVTHKPNDIAGPAIKYVPPVTTLATYLAVRDATDASDKFLVTTEGEITTAAKVWLRGINTDDPLRYPVDGSKFKVDQNGNVTASGSVTANNLPAVPSAKAGKRIHWGTFSGTTDSTGQLTVTHGAGFTPSVVIPVQTSVMGGGGAIGVMGANAITSTTFFTRFNGISSPTAVTGAFVCFE